MVVDDEPLSLTNAKNLLHEQNMRVSCIRSGKEFLSFIEKNTPDLVLLDIMMPEMDGFETYRALRLFEERSERAQIPVIFLTGEDDSEIERRGLKVGASDFIHKPFDKEILISRVKNTIENSKTIEALTEEATFDKLTGFLNKAGGTGKIAELCRSVSGALLILDLDNFKLVNDLYGHDMGDRILVAFASVVRLNVRSDDVICRIGGDEFLGFFADMNTEDAVATLTERLNDQLAGEAEKLMGSEHGIPLGISVGAVFIDEQTKEYQFLFQCADSALYEAKRNGKHDYRIFDPDVTSEDGKLDLDGEIVRLTQILSERNNAAGAMILGQEAFSWIYRYTDRLLSRYGGLSARILFSLSSDDSGIIFSDMVAGFGNVLRTTLRKTDIIMQWQQNMYFLVLPFRSRKDTGRVVERILKRWHDVENSDKIRIQYTAVYAEKEEYELKEQ